ncbi:MAG: hypothetical protein NTV81_01310 [Candidatus Komeilibacteria bacterium]|nr:hypothetical protein [Candidatus Komeilibacteria bacterium]
MKIGVDARMIGTRHRGIGRYVLELVKGLRLQQTHQLTYYYYSKDQLDYFSGLSAKQWPWRWYSIFEFFLILMCRYFVRLSFGWLFMI